MLSNDNHPADGGSPPPLDPHSQAALILVESLIHVLKERSILTAADSLDVVSTAIEVQEDYAREAEPDSGEMWRAHALLSRIASSLKSAA